MALRFAPLLACVLSVACIGTLAHGAAGAVKAAANGNADKRETKLNDGWKFLRIDNPPQDAPTDEHAGAAVKDASWDAVALPHTPRVEKLIAYDQWRGICWYRRHLTPDPKWKGRKVAIRFDAAMIVADVWVNGKHVTTHHGGYLPFTIDLTDALQPGDNVIAVRLDNRDNPDVPPGKPLKDLDFCWFGGLYRNAWLVVTDPLHITDPVAAGKPASGGVFVTFPEATNERAVVDVKVHAQNDGDATANCAVKIELIDADDKVVKTVQTDPANVDAGTDAVLAAQVEVASPNLWSMQRPYLYRVRTTLLDGTRAVDTVTTRVGIRRIAFSRSGGFEINGERVYLRGVNRHQDTPTSATPSPTRPSIATP